MEENSLKQDKKFFSSIGLRYFLGTLIIYGVQLGVTFIVMFIQNYISFPFNSTINMLISMLPMYLVGMPLLILLVSRVPAVGIKEKHKMSVGQIIIAFLMCYAIMYISNIIGNIITFLIGLVKGSNVNNAIMELALENNIWVNLIFMVICAPIYEEFIFRKLVVDRAVKYGEGIAVLLSGFMFGLFHGNLNQFAYAFTIGAFFAFIYVKTGKIQYTIILHMIVNFAGGVLSTWILKATDYMEFVEAAQELQLNPENMEALMEYMPGVVGMLVYAGCLFALVIAGIVLLIVKRKKFKFAPGEITIPKGKRFLVVIVNVGMLLFCGFWTIMIIVQLFQS